MKLLFALVLVLVVSQAAASARPPSPVALPFITSGDGHISLSDAIQLAWQRALVSRASLGLRQQAEAEKRAAFLPWAEAPTLELMHWSDRWETDAGQRESELGLTWPLLMPGQGAARRATARAGLALADATRRLALLQLALEVRESAWSLLALQSELDQAEAGVVALAALTDDVERRVRAGDLARVDALMARSEMLVASSRRTEVRQRLSTARASWVLLTGQDALPAPELIGAEPVQMTDEELAGHPALQLAAMDKERARSRLAQARYGQRAPPELVLGMRRETFGNGQTDQSSLAIGLRLPLAGSAHARSLQVSALTELELAELERERVQERLRAEAQMAQEAVLASAEQLQAAQSRSALLRERAQLVYQSFRVGESPLPELLRALAAATDAEAALGRQQAALGLAHARLHHALGKIP